MLRLRDLAFLLQAQSRGSAVAADRGFLAFASAVAVIAAHADIHVRECSLFCFRGFGHNDSPIHKKPWECLKRNLGSTVKMSGYM